MQLADSQIDPGHLTALAEAAGELMAAEMAVARVSGRRAELATITRGLNATLSAQTGFPGVLA